MVSEDFVIFHFLLFD